MTITFMNPLETPTIIHLHFTGKRQGSICHDDRWRIDPWLYGDIRCTKRYNTNTASRQF